MNRRPHARRCLLTACLLSLCVIVAVCLSTVAMAAEKSPAASPPAKPAIPQASIFRILNGSEEGYSIGSGTLIDRNEHFGLVLTCGHIFDEKVQAVSVVSPAGVQYIAEVCAIDKPNDLALLWIGPPDEQPVAVSNELPELHDSLVSAGYGSDGVLLPNLGRVTAFAMLERNSSSDVIEITGAARQGDSGGPMFDRHSQLVGVILGTDGGSVDGMGCERIHDLVRANADRKPSRPESLRRRRPSHQWIASAGPIEYRALKVEAEEAPARPTVRVDLVGRLTINGRGVSKATVNATAQSGVALTHAATITDEEGRFRFTGLQAGVYAVRAEGIALNKIRSVEKQVSLEPETKSKTLQLKFE
jgi:S1-C subfamily serine protease